MELKWPDHKPKMERIGSAGIVCKFTWRTNRKKLVVKVIGYANANNKIYQQAEMELIKELREKNGKERRRSK